MTKPLKFSTTTTPPDSESDTSCTSCRHCCGPICSRYQLDALAARSHWQFCGPLGIGHERTGGAWMESWPVIATLLIIAAAVVFARLSGYLGTLEAFFA